MPFCIFLFVADPKKKPSLNRTPGVLKRGTEEVGILFLIRDRLLNYLVTSMPICKSSGSDLNALNDQPARSRPNRGAALPGKIGAVPIGRLVLPDNGEPWPDESNLRPSKWRSTSTRIRLETHHHRFRDPTRRSRGRSPPWRGRPNALCAPSNRIRDPSNCLRDPANAWRDAAKRQNLAEKTRENATDWACTPSSPQPIDSSRQRSALEATFGPENGNGRSRKVAGNGLSDRAKGPHPYQPGAIPHMRQLNELLASLRLGGD